MSDNYSLLEKKYLKFSKKYGIDIVKKDKDMSIPNIEFTEKQKEYIADPATKIVVSGGRGSGKSTPGLHKVMTSVKQGHYALILGMSSPNVKGILLDYFRLLDSGMPTIDDVNGFKWGKGHVTILGADNKNQIGRIQGRNFDELYVLEPTTIGFLPEVLKECLTRIRSGHARVIFDVNPTKKNHWFYQEFYCNDNYKKYEFYTLENKHLKPSPEIYAELNFGAEGTVPYRQNILNEWVLEDGTELYKLPKMQYYENLINTYAFIDLSYSLEEGTDFTAIAIGKIDYSKDPRGVLVITGKLFKNRDFLLKEFPKIYDQYKIREVYYDASMDSHFAFVSEIMITLKNSKYNHSNFNILPLKREKQNKVAKIVGQITYLLNRNRLILSNCMDQDFHYQLSAYNGSDSNTGNHDDAPDALACLIRELRTPRKTRYDAYNKKYNMLRDSDG